MRVMPWRSNTLISSRSVASRPDEGLEFLVLALLLADRGERAAQIVGDRQYVAREFGRGIGVRVGDLLVLAARDVLRLGARLKQVLLTQRDLPGELRRHLLRLRRGGRSEEHTSELQSLMRNTYA